MFCTGAGMMLRPVFLAMLLSSLGACTPDDSRSASDTSALDSAGRATADSARDTVGVAGDSANRGEPSATMITPDGWGPLRIGMTRAEVVAAAGEDANPNAVGGPEPEVCDEFRPEQAPNGVLVMIERGILTRISISRNTDISTPAGFRVGDPAASVEQHYGADAEVTPHKYQEAPARYVTAWRQTTAAAERRGIRYEIGADGAVMHIRAGGPSIEYVEGCL